MVKIPVLFMKELKSYFYSPIAYVVLVVFLGFNGYIFALLVSALNDPRMTVEGSAMQLFFGGTIFFYLVLSIAASVITMRLIAEERKSGTMEVIMTAPITDVDLVLSKFLGALAFYLFLWMPTLLYVVVLRRYSSGVDFGPIAAGYLGTTLLGAMFLSVGLFFSSLTKNQIVAAIGSFVVVTVLWTLGVFKSFVSGTLAQGIISYLNIFEHFDSFNKGIIDTRPLVYYISATALCLFLTVKVVESHKWR